MRTTCTCGGSDPAEQIGSPVAFAGGESLPDADAKTLVTAKPEFRQIAANRLEPERGVFNGTPAVSHGAIFPRSDRFLYCISKD